MKNTPIERLKEMIEVEGSQVAAARKLNVSPSLLSEMKHGTRSISPEVLGKLGLVKIELFVDKSQAKEVREKIAEVMK